MMNLMILYILKLLIAMDSLGVIQVSGLSNQDNFTQIFKTNLNRNGIMMVSVIWVVLLNTETLHPLATKKELCSKKVM
jgi:hypothetical protein